METISSQELPNIIGDFYFSARKKRISEEDTLPNDKEKARSKLSYYKNSSLKAGRAALNRYFKANRGIDIISNDSFIKVSEIFTAVTKQGKEEGHGETDSKLPISEPDLSKLSTYFLNKMRGPPNAVNLQEFVLFNIIYYMGRRGRENLQSMKFDTFTLKKDHDGREYIAQVIKECDKNHRENDYSKSNEARIYAQPDKNHFHNNKKQFISNLNSYDKATFMSK